MSFPEGGPQKTSKDAKPKGKADDQNQDQFSIRRVHVKQEFQRHLMRPMSPYQTKGPLEKNPRERIQLSCKPVNKATQSSTQEAILSSNAYKELNRKFISLKREQAEEREKVMNSIRQKTDRIQKAREDKDRLQKERERLTIQARLLAERLQMIRQRNNAIRQNMEEYQSMMNAEYLRNLILSVRFQHELLHQDINPDNMTYEQLLQLEQKIGNVSKGLTEEQLNKLTKFSYEPSTESENCTICCYELKESDETCRLNCSHLFHWDCIKEWLAKEKCCPMCKQEVSPKS